MTTLSAEQASLLSLCIDHNGGKIDFAGVARDFERIHGEKLTSVAVLKRFQRLKTKLEGSGGVQNSPSKSKTTSSPTKRTIESNQPQTPTKKIKREIKQED